MKNISNNNNYWEKCKKQRTKSIKGEGLNN